MSSAQGFRISRATGSDGFSVDTHAKFVFEPALESDELFDALRVAYPHAKTHAERKRQAVLDFLVQEREDDLKALDQLVNGESTSPVQSWSTERTQSVEQTPASTSFASFSPTTSAQPSPVAIAPNFQAEASGSATNPAFHVWNSSNNKPVKLHKRRCMTDKEKEEYRQRRLVGSCHSCKQKRRKCRHHESTTTNSAAPSRASKRSKSSKATSTPAPTVSKEFSNDSSPSEATTQSCDPSPAVPSTSFLGQAEFTFDADMSGQLFDGDFPLFSETMESDFFSTALDQPFYDTTDLSYPDLNAQFNGGPAYTTGLNMSGAHESIIPESAPDWLILPSPETNIDFYSTSSSSPRQSPQQPLNALSSNQDVIWPDSSGTRDREKMKTNSGASAQRSRGGYSDELNHTSPRHTSPRPQMISMTPNGNSIESGIERHPLLVTRGSRVTRNFSLLDNESIEGARNRLSSAQSAKLRPSTISTTRAPDALPTPPRTTIDQESSHMSSLIVSASSSPLENANSNSNAPSDRIRPRPRNSYKPLVPANSNASGQYSRATLDEKSEYLESVNKRLQSISTRPRRSSHGSGSRPSSETPEFREARSGILLISGHPDHLHVKRNMSLRDVPTTLLGKKKTVNYRLSAPLSSTLPHMKETLERNRTKCAPAPRTTEICHGLRSGPSRSIRTNSKWKSDHGVRKSVGSYPLSSHDELSTTTSRTAVLKLAELGSPNFVGYWLQSLLSLFCLQAAHFTAYLQDLSDISIGVASLLGSTYTSPSAGSFESSTNAIRSLPMSALAA